MIVKIAEAAPLTAEEKEVFLPDLRQRNLNPLMLDIMNNIPERINIIKVYSDDGELIGLSSVILTPNLFMKHCYGQGNHIGTNNTFFFAPYADRTEVIAAIFSKLLEMRPAGHYVGFVDEELTTEFKAALDRVPHVVAEKVMQSGSIPTQNPDAEQILLKNHTHLSRQINRFRNRGGTIHVIEGKVEGELAEAFVACCLDSYSKNAHPGMPINIEAYSRHVLDFITTTLETVHIYAVLDNKVVGVQTFIRHPKHIELTEGGFLSQTCHAYENIILESVRYSVKNGLERVSYGLILNPNKNRLMDTETRRPVYLIMFFREAVNPMMAEQCRLKAHERFPMLLWEDRSVFKKPTLV